MIRENWRVNMGAKMYCIIEKFFKFWIKPEDEEVKPFKSSQLICRENQLTDFYMRGTLVVKRLIQNKIFHLYLLYFKRSLEHFPKLQETSAGEYFFSEANGKIEVWKFVQYAGGDGNPEQQFSWVWTDSSFNHFAAWSILESCLEVQQAYGS